jgi:hypothetical protein
MYATANLVDASRGTDEARAPAWILAPNPLAALADVIEGEQRLGSITTASPFDALMALIDRGEESEGDVVFEAGAPAPFIGDDGRAVLEPDGGSDGIGMVWLTSALLGLMAVAGIVIGARRLRAPAATER